MKNTILISLCFVMLFSCTHRTQLNEVAQKESTKRNEEKNIDTLFAMINKDYQPKYLEVNNYQSTITGDKMKSFTNEGMSMHFDILGIISESEVVGDKELDAIHTKLQTTLQTAIELPDYQRLLTGTATKFMAKRLLRSASNTPKEKELILFYTHSFVEQKGRNYYLVYTALKRLDSYAKTEEIKGLAQKILEIKPSSQSEMATRIAQTQKQEKIWYEKMAEGERHNQIYRVKLQEFL